MDGSEVMMVDLEDFGVRCLRYSDFMRGNRKVRGFADRHQGSHLWPPLKPAIGLDSLPEGFI